MFLAGAARETRTARRGRLKNKFLMRCMNMLKNKKCLNYQVSKDLISKQVRSLRCHAAVKWSKPELCHWEPGKARLARKLSQKNCLKKLTGVYCERQKTARGISASFCSFAGRRFFLPEKMRKINFLCYVWAMLISWLLKISKSYIGVDEYEPILSG